MDQKYEEMDLKFEGTDQQIEVLKKAKMDQKYEETNLKFEETNQQNLRKSSTKLKILKFLKKSGNGSKIRGNGPKI